MKLPALYRRVFALLKPEKNLVATLALAGVFIGLFQIIQVLLFANFIEALARLQPAAFYLVVWAVLGLAAIAAHLWLAQHAERLAHQQRFTIMGDYTERVVGLAPAHLSAAESKKQSDRLMQILLRGSDQLFFIWLQFFRDHLAAAATFALALLLALYINGLIALLLILLSGGFIILNVAITRRAYDEQMKFEKFHAHIAERAGSMMGNAAVIQSYTRLEAEISGLREAMQHVLSAQFPVLNWWTRKSALANSAAAVFVVSTLSLGSYFYSEGQIDLGDVIVLAGLSLLLLSRADSLSGFANVLLFNTEEIRDFFNVLDIDAAVKQDESATELNVDAFKIEFKDVRFESGDEISFTIAPGETVAFLDKDGRTAQLLAAGLMRTIAPESGQILIDGQDIAKVSLASLRRNISYIARDAGLLHRPVMENLILGKPDATQDEIIAAVKRAEAHDFIAAKRDGFHTFVSERAENFSDDERRQILIARALLKNAPLMIYEDGDAEVENKKLSRAIDHVLKGRAAILLTSNPSMLEKAKRVFVFENGRLIVAGRPHEALENSPANGPRQNEAEDHLSAKTHGRKKTKTPQDV